MSLTKDMDITYVYDLVNTLAQGYRTLLVVNDKVATGKLKDFTTRVEITDDNLKVIYNLPEYWQWVEDGRPPSTMHRPPALQPAILDWIEQRNIVPRAGKDGKIPSNEELSWMITKKIHKAGYKGKPMLKQSLEDGKQVIDNIVYMAAQAVGQREIDEELVHVFDGMDKPINI